MIHRLSFRMLLVLLSALGPFCAGGESAADVGVWSKEARFLGYHAGTRRVEVPAPDKQKTAIIDEVTLAVVIDGRRLLGTENVGVATLAELAWAPDSTAFFVTESYGGNVGEWIVTVYLIKDERIQRIDVTGEVVKQFKKHYTCREPQDPNVGAIKWLKGSKNLLLLAEVPPHSNCPEMGKIRGYIVEVSTGKIIQEFGERELRTRWGRYLGERFGGK